MRALFLLLAFAIYLPASGQDFCKHIKKEISPDKKIFDYSSPLDTEEVTTLRVTRSINIDPDYESDNFFLIFQLTGDIDAIYTKTAEGEQTEKDEFKLIVEFDDKSQLVDDTIRISHDLTSDKMRAIRNIYYPLGESTIQDFSTKKIKKFSLAGYEKAISPDYANAIMNYVACVKKVK